jgi:predicted  nucleic acid-binding Zn-ribbon protein
MSEKVLEGIVVLNKNIGRLLDEYNNLKADYDKLQKELNELSYGTRQKESELDDLKRSYERAKLTGALMGEGENARDAKRKLNELVREIDNCIALLNR